MSFDYPEVNNIRDDLYCAMFEHVIEDQMIINYSHNVIAKASKLSVRSVTPYTKTQVNFLNGNQFFGDINACRMSGSGRYLWADDGSLYEGDFQRPNVIEGRGTFKFRNHKRSTGSSKYCGSFLNGKFHGKGQLMSYFFKYNGNFEDDKFHGRGCIKSGIELFDGWFDRDKKVMGKRVYTDGVFIGDFHDDETRKCGKYKFDNGDVYIGSFENGLFDGFGEYTWSSGKYSGYWRQNQRNGLGIVKAGDMSCVTLFRKSAKDGAGVVWATNGKVYASREMFKQDEFVRCVEVDVNQKNIDIIRRLMDPSELQLTGLSVKMFTSIVGALVDEFGRKVEPPIYPFHVSWFELKVDHLIIWNFIRDFPNTNKEQENVSIVQTVKEFINVFEKIYQRYADFSSKAIGKSSTSLLRIGLWQLIRDLELYKKSAAFNVQTTLETANREFNILCINPDDPFEPVSISSMAQYLMFITLHLNMNHDFVLSCAINQRSKIFGLFGTMLVIFVREFLASTMSSPHHSGMIAKLAQDNRMFVTNFLTILDLKGQKFSIRSVFRVAELWKCGQKNELAGKIIALNGIIEESSLNSSLCRCECRRRSKFIFNEHYKKPDARLPTANASVPQNLQFNC